MTHICQSILAIFPHLVFALRICTIHDRDTAAFFFSYLFLIFVRTSKWYRKYFSELDSSLRYEDGTATKSQIFEYVSWLIFAFVNGYCVGPLIYMCRDHRVRGIKRFHHLILFTDILSYFLLFSSPRCLLWHRN